MDACPSTIPLPSKSTFYEPLAVLGRTAEAVRRRLYVLFPGGMSEAKICEKMRASLEDWRPEAASTTDAMDVVDQPSAAPASTGKRGADRGRCGAFVSKRKPPDEAAGSTHDGQLTADLASKVALGA